MTRIEVRQKAPAVWPTFSLQYKIDQLDHLLEYVYPTEEIFVSESEKILSPTTAGLAGKQSEAKSWKIAATDCFQIHGRAPLRARGRTRVDQW